MGRLRVAVVGGGRFGIEHIISYLALPECTLVGIVEPDESRRAILSSGRIVPSTVPLYGSVHDLLAATDVTAASVVAPSRFHRTIASELMKAGTDILVEKPFAESVEDAGEIAREATDLGRVCLPGHVLRFSPQHRALRERIRARTMGELIAIDLRRDRSSELTSAYPGEHPARLTGVHDVDLAIWLTGQNVAKVRAGEHRSPGGGADLFWAQLRHVDGALSSIRGAYILSKDTPDATSDQIDVHGSAGVETIRDEMAGNPLLQSDSAGQLVNVPLYNELSHFLKCVSESRPSELCTPAEAVHVVDVVRAIIESAGAGGHPVALQPAERKRLRR